MFFLSCMTFKLLFLYILLKNSKNAILFGNKKCECYIYHILIVVVVAVKVTQLCSTLCDPMDYSLLGSSVRGILQARILDWVVIPFSRGSSRFRD